MIENAENIQEEEIAIEVDSSEEVQPESGDDELERYTKGVSKRINKLNQKTRQAEDRARHFEMLTQQKDAELQKYREMYAQSAQSALDAEEEKLKTQEAQVDDIYRKAVQSSDPDLMSKADTLKNDIAIKKEKLRTAKNRQPVEPQPVAQQQYEQAPQQQVEQEVQPSQEALQWHSKNSWYGDQSKNENVEATQYAYFTHYNLINEGYEPDSEDYYSELDTRVKRVYPNLVSEESSEPAVEQKTTRPAVQRVASSSSGGRQKTQGTEKGVKFRESELERLKGLKPHNMSDEKWLQMVAKEKQKIQAREAS